MGKNHDSYVGGASSNSRESGKERKDKEVTARSRQIGAANILPGQIRPAPIALGIIG